MVSKICLGSTPHLVEVHGNQQFCPQCNSGLFVPSIAVQNNANLTGPQILALPISREIFSELADRVERNGGEIRAVIEQQSVSFIYKK